MQERGSGEMSVDVDRIRRGKSTELVPIKLKCVYEVVSTRLAKGEGIGGAEQVQIWTSVDYNPPPSKSPTELFIAFLLRSLEQHQVTCCDSLSSILPKI
jgi:hypothetical protein